MEGTIRRLDEAGTVLTLPETVFLLARRRSGFMVARQSIREALLGAAVLAELRLLHRIDLDPDGTVRVYDPAPTGAPSLDAVLDRMQAAEPRRSRLGLDLTSATGRCQIVRAAEVGVTDLGTHKIAGHRYFSMTRDL